MKKPEITRECIKPCFDSKYLNVVDFQYAEGRHYYDASRHKTDDLVVLKSDEEFKNMLPDAVTCIVIIRQKDGDKLLLEKEFRYPCGRFLSGPPAGLMDPDDKDEIVPQFATAKREIFEETGIEINDADKIFMVNPLAFSTPGMTDESNALVCAVLERDEIPALTDQGAETTECFEGFVLLSKDEARKYLKDGRDDRGFFYSMYTWAALMYFVSGMYEEN